MKVHLLGGPADGHIVNQDVPLPETILFPELGQGKRISEATGQPEFPTYRYKLKRDYLQEPVYVYEELNMETL